ncbi:MAG TPA: hypothetical protein VKB26_10820 [Candidatus Acidoferrales bacterium]|nr:hypothetical protein [Candidatus Acidoferrales bacterium]
MKSHETLLLSKIVGIAALIVIAACFGASSILVLALHVSAAINGALTLAVLVAVLGSTTRYLFRRFQVAHFNRREACGVAIAFVVCFPIALSIALALYGIPAAVAGVLMPASRVGFLILLFVETAIIGAFLTVLGCAFALWIIRRTQKAESHDQPAQIDNATS